MKDTLAFLDQSAATVAPQLLGSILERTINGTILRGRIVETEAYDETDLASHSYRGETSRTKVMFGDSGHLYVYFTYGMHYCSNIVVGPPGHGAAVLIRAIEPLEGESDMIDFRRGKNGIELTNGPAKICQAFAIDMSLNGHNLVDSPLRLLPGTMKVDESIVQTTRIGISQAKDTPWRFYIKNNKYVSRKS